VISGPQGDWLASKLDHLPADVDFVFLVMHYPPYTSSSDAKMFGGGHSARSTEQALAKMLEARQQRAVVRFVVFAGHVHNYERHEHGGVTYFVTGGGGAHAYPVERAPGDLYPDNRINYHYLLAEVDRGKLKITMNRLELTDGKAVWTQPDSVTIAVPALEHTKPPHVENIRLQHHAGARIVQADWHSNRIIFTMAETKRRRPHASHTAHISCEILPLVLVVLQANLKLANGFVGCPERFDAVPAKIVRRVFQMFFRATQRT
jgi:hypothetical protein